MWTFDARATCMKCCVTCLLETIKTAHTATVLEFRAFCRTTCMYVYRYVQKQNGSGNWFRLCLTMLKPGIYPCYEELCAAAKSLSTPGKIKKPLDSKLCSPATLVLLRSLQNYDPDLFRGAGLSPFLDSYPFSLGGV